MLDLGTSFIARVERDPKALAIVDGAHAVLKDMQSGAQETMDRGSVVHAVLRGLRELG